MMRKVMRKVMPKIHNWVFDNVSSGSLLGEILLCVPKTQHHTALLALLYKLGMR